MSDNTTDITVDYTAKFWQGGRNFRVYITKNLGHGKSRRCGYADLTMKAGKVASWMYYSSTRANELDISGREDYVLVIDLLILKAGCQFVDGYVIG